MPPLSYTVGPANTFTVLTAAPPSPSQYLQPVAFTASVSGAFGGSPTGTVDFTSDGQPISIDCTGVPLTQQQSGSTATCVTTALSVASHQILATYNATPNGNFNGSPSSPLSYVVGPAGTTTTLTAIPANKSTYLQDIQFTATVTGAYGGSPTGTVSFTTDTGGPIPHCTSLPLTSLLLLKKGKAQRSGSGGKGSPQDNGSAATCDVPQGLPLGSYMVQATYDPMGDPDFTAGSPSKMLPYEVDAADTTTVLTAVPTSSQYLQPVTFTATVSGANGGSPLGTVTFTDSVDGQLCGGPVSLVAQQTGSTATCMTTSLSVTNSHQITATYNGDDPNGDFKASPPSQPLPYQVTGAVHHHRAERNAGQPIQLLPGHPVHGNGHRGLRREPARHGGLHLR